MNKFIVFPCTNKENKEGYSGQVVSLVCASTSGLAICFPISEENSKIINKVLENHIDKKNIDNSINNNLAVYKAMVDSWNSGCKFLSGIYMDMELDPIDKIEIISTKAIISENNYGIIDNIVKINFVHAIIIAAMYKIEIVISKELIEKLLPTLDRDEYEDSKKLTKNNSLKKTKEGMNSPFNNEKFPKDEKILKIAKKIMDGKIK
jgi:hypothetical protein